MSEVTSPNAKIETLVEKKQALYPEWKELQKQNKEREWSDDREGRFQEINAEFDAIDAEVTTEELAIKRAVAFDRQEELSDRFSSAQATVHQTVDESCAESESEMRIVRALNGFLRNKHASVAERSARASCGLEHQNEIELRFPTRSISTFNGPQLPEGRITRKAFEEFAIRRDLGTAPDSLGGFTVPEGLMEQIDIALAFFNTGRNYATVIASPDGREKPHPTVNDSDERGERVDENIEANQGDITFGQVLTKPKLYSSKYIPVSIQLMQDSNENMDALVTRLVAERISRIQSDEFATGSGVGDVPEGIATAALDSTVVLSGSNKPTANDLLDLKYSVDRAYRQIGHGFLMHDTVLGGIRGLGGAETDGRLLWQPSLAFGEPSTIDGDPYFLNNSLDTTLLTGRPLLYGQLNKFKIHDVAGPGMVIRRLDEIRALQHQVVFLGFMRSDCRLIDAGSGPVKYALQAAA